MHRPFAALAVLGVHHGVRGGFHGFHLVVLRLLLLRFLHRVRVGLVHVLEVVIGGGRVVGGGERVGGGRAGGLGRRRSIVVVRGHRDRGDDGSRASDAPPAGGDGARGVEHRPARDEPEEDERHERGQRPVRVDRPGQAVERRRELPLPEGAPGVRTQAFPHLSVDVLERAHHSLASS